MIVRLCLLFLLAALSACSSVFTAEPVGIGKDRDALKRSPCACTEVPQDYAEWRRQG